MPRSVAIESAAINSAKRRGVEFAEESAMFPHSHSGLLLEIYGLNYCLRLIVLALLGLKQEMGGEEQPRQSGITGIGELFAQTISKVAPNGVTMI
jgi:hypothetical protein